MRVNFQTHEIINNNPFAQLPKHIYLAVLADTESNYTIYVRFNNGLVLSSIGKLSLFDAFLFAERIKEELQLPDASFLLDIPNSILELPDIRYRKLKKRMQRLGLR